MKSLISFFGYYFVGAIWLSASESDFKLLPQKKHRVSEQRALKISDQNTKLLALAEEVAHFGSWELDTSQPRAIWSPGMFGVFGIKPRAEGFTWEEYTSFIHPDDREAAMKNAATMMNSPLNHRESFDYRIIRCDGSVRMLHSQRQVREVTADGKAKVVVGVDQDVTEQKHAEEALKHSEERFRAVAEAADVAVYETDVKTGKIKVLRGTEELTGYRPDEVNYTVDWVISQMHPDDVPHVRATLKATTEDPNIDKYVLEYRFRHKNGNYIIVKDTAKAVKDANGNTVLFIGGIRDITQRVRDQEEIKQYSRHLEELVAERTRQLQEKERLAAIGQTAGMVGHDIRNPLQAIIGEVYLIKTELPDLPKSQTKQNIQESLDSIEQGISYTNKVVADLQDYSRQLNAEKQSVNLASLVAEVFQAITIPNNVKLAFDFEPMPNVKLDPTFTRRALTNLINNAIQAMPNGGQLVISANQEENTTNICICDSGVGIPEALKAKIFLPMFTTKAKGQGLGLAVVKRLVEAQGGVITFDSEVGKGTKFCIKLPQ